MQDDNNAWVEDEHEVWIEDGSLNLSGGAVYKVKSTQGKILCAIILLVPFIFFASVCLKAFTVVVNEPEVTVTYFLDSSNTLYSYTTYTDKNEESKYRKFSYNKFTLIPEFEDLDDTFNGDDLKPISQDEAFLIITEYRVDEDEM